MPTQAQGKTRSQNRARKRKP
uniref:Uncharacterized protein MANES_08G145100 n=1 Tax=Rhizophora mucronata TaxID=61149 RepID=A0A2P2J496_RHIMU